MLRERNVGALRVRGQPGRLHLPSVVESPVGESVASQSRYSLPRVLSFTPTIVSEVAVQTFGVQQSVVVGQVVGLRSVEAVTNALFENEVPLAAFSRSFRAKSRMKEDFFKLSCQGVLKIL